jgi:TonB family protein
MKLLALLFPLYLSADALTEARAEMNRGNLVNAEQLLVQAIDRATFFKTSSAADAPLDLLAQVYRREKKFPEAIAAEQRRIDLWSHLIDENAVVVGRVFGQMAMIEKQAGNLPIAETHARRALAIINSNYLAKPPTAQAQIDLADILLAENHNEDADQLLASAQQIFESFLGAQSSQAFAVAKRRASILNQPPPPEPPNTFNIGRDVTAPTIKVKIEPKYSEEARKKKLQGTIQLSVVIDATGAPTQIAVLRPLGFGLDEKAVEAVSQWKFIPATKNGTPVALVSTIEVTLHLL